MTKEDIVRKIQALQERTVDRGCSEAEAMTAARMVGKLLEQHGLSMSDIEIQERKDCERLDIMTGRKRAHEISFCISAIGALYDCRVWMLTGDRTNGGIYTFFGFPEDVQACKYLYQVIMASMAHELSGFKWKSKREGKPTGKRQSHAFLLGMANRINARLRQIKREQTEETKQSTGRELVVVKNAVVESAFNDLGIKLGTRSAQSSMGDSGAFFAGREAGNKTNLGNKGIGNQKSIS